MSEVRIPFEITATNLNLADTADQAIYVFETNANVVRVPAYLTLTRKAGTGYTVGNRRANRAKHSTERVLDGTAWDYTDAGDMLESLDFAFTIGTAASPRRNVVAFRAPLKELNFQGLLNTTTGATTATDSSLVVFPEVQERYSKPDQYISLSARSNVSLAGGTGSLLGEFIFNEYVVRS